MLKRYVQSTYMQCIGAANVGVFLWINLYWINILFIFLTVSRRHSKDRYRLRAFIYFVAYISWIIFLYLEIQKTCNLRITAYRGFKLLLEVLTFLADVTAYYKFMYYSFNFRVLITCINVQITEFTLRNADRGARKKILYLHAGSRSTTVQRYWRKGF
jgi:hypothetical protein